LTVAAEAGVRPATTRFPLEEANSALAAMRSGRIEGAAVLVP
ncbi:MAG TPA: alcohol dehydrogenase, partial [Thermoplasmata archaeon]|nr:alcohol dehydrogenase [Thermoplasmata archaeon]